MIYLTLFRKPKVGERIKLLFLPPPSNVDSFFVRNCYIGSEGIVKSIEDGWYELRMNTAWLCGHCGIFTVYRTLPLLKPANFVV